MTIKNEPCQELAEKMEVILGWLSDFQLHSCSMPATEAGFTEEQFEDIRKLTDRYMELKKTHNYITSARIARTEFIADALSKFAQKLITTAG